jgi:hypothetical protein
VLQRKLRSLSNVTVVTRAQTTQIEGDGKKVTALSYNDLRSTETKRIELEGVFVQIGLVPNTEWLKGTIELSSHGEIVVDAKGATSLPGVFAAGDVTTTPFKQIVIAVGDGAKASLGAFDYLIRSGTGPPVSVPEAGPKTAREKNERRAPLHSSDARRSSFSVYRAACRRLPFSAPVIHIVLDRMTVGDQRLDARLVRHGALDGELGCFVVGAIHILLVEIRIRHAPRIDPDEADDA